MTEEEMADIKLAEDSWRSKNLEYKVNFHERSYVDGFLAGLKAGRPKWHDLREDPNDLPKKNGRFFVTLENGLTKFSYYYHSEKKFTVWNKEYGSNIKLHNVIAWYEIPRFEGVE